MTNINDITSYKQKAINLIINNQNIVDLIDEKDIQDVNTLINANIFSYCRTPATEEETKTYLYIAVEVPIHENANHLMRNIVLTFVAVCHHSTMNVVGTEGNRVDLLGCEIDKLFNGNSTFGIGALKLVSDEESQVDKTHSCRTMKFTVEDFNGSRCKG